MKKFILPLFALYMTTIDLNAAIVYEAKEYKPKGKHYTTKYNLVYHFYSPITSEKVILLYYKTGNGIAFYKGIEVSESLANKLPRLVIKYIGLNIADMKMKETHSVDKVKDVIKIAVERALDQKYKNLLLTEGTKLVQDSAYFRGYFNSKWWMPNYYYDYEPAFSQDTINNFLTNSIIDDRFPGINYITDTLKHFNYHHDTKSIAKWGEIFKKVRFTTNERTIRDYGFVNTSIKNDDSYHKRSDSCRFTLKKVNISHGKRYPVFASVSIFGWQATYCNYLASDLRKAVFGNPLWETNGCKKDYTYLTSNSDFVEITKSEIYKYANAGYLVFMIDKGHIATVYPNGEKLTKGIVDYPAKVLQAGSETGIINLLKVWENFVDNPVIKSYLYLGHLKSY